MLLWLLPTTTGRVMCITTHATDSGCCIHPKPFFFFNFNGGFQLEAKHLTRYGKNSSQILFFKKIMIEKITFGKNKFTRKFNL